MPLGGTGSVLGNVLAGAVGAPAAAGSFFGLVGGVIAAWAPSNIQVKPTAMAASSGSVSGKGTFKVTGTKEDLGNRLADALLIPADAPDARAKWIATAGAFIKHLEDHGEANGTGLSSGTPLAGKGTVTFKLPAFVPPLAEQLEVEDPVAAVALEAFGAGLISHIQTNADVVGLALPDADGNPGIPLSAPPDGPVAGTGTIA